LFEFFFGKGKPLQRGFMLDLIKDVEINLAVESGVESAMESIL